MEYMSLKIKEAYVKARDTCIFRRKKYIECTYEKRGSIIYFLRLSICTMQLKCLLNNR